MDNIVRLLVLEFRLLSSVISYLNMDVFLRGIGSLQTPLISVQVLGGQYLLKCGDMNLVT